MIRALRGWTMRMRPVFTSSVICTTALAMCWEMPREWNWARLAIAALGAAGWREPGLPHAETIMPSAKEAERVWPSY